LKLEVQWLAYLANEAGILDSAKCLVLKHALGPEADLLSFGEKLIDRGYCTDIDTLQNLIESAHVKGESGVPVPSDPFEILQSNSKRTFGRRSTATEEPSPLRLSSIKLSNAEDSASSTSRPSLGSNKPWKPSEGRRKYTDDPFERSPTHPHTELPRASNGPISSITSTAQAAQNISLRQDPAKTGQAPVALAQQAPAIAAVITDQPTLEPKLSKERPDVTLNVEDEWPDFQTIASMSVPEARQCMVQLLLKSQSEGASDLHLCADACPFIRKHSF